MGGLLGLTVKVGYRSGCVVFGGQGGERGRSSMGGRSSSMIGALVVLVFTLSSTSGGRRRQLGRQQDRHDIHTRTPTPLMYVSLALPK